MPPETRRRSASTTNTDVAPENPAANNPKAVEVDLGPHTMVYEGVHYGPGKVKVPTKEQAADMTASKERADRRVAGISENVRQEMHAIDEDDYEEDEDEDEDDTLSSSQVGTAKSGEDPSDMVS